MILMGPFQLEIFYYSINAAKSNYTGYPENLSHGPLALLCD